MQRKPKHIKDGYISFTNLNNSSDYILMGGRNEQTFQQIPFSEKELIAEAKRLELLGFKINIIEVCTYENGYELIDPVRKTIKI